MQYCFTEIIVSLTKRDGNSIILELDILNQYLDGEKLLLKLQQVKEKYKNPNQIKRWKYLVLVLFEEGKQHVGCIKHLKFYDQNPRQPAAVRQRLNKLQFLNVLMQIRVTIEYFMK